MTSGFALQHSAMVNAVYSFMNLGNINLRAGAFDTILFCCTLCITIFKQPVRFYLISARVLFDKVSVNLFKTNKIFFVWN